MLASTDKGKKNAAIYAALENYVAGRNGLPATADLAEEAGLNKTAAKKALKRLEANGEVKAAHRAPNKATIWVPTYMWEALIRFKEAPPWLENFALERRKEIEREIRDYQVELDQLRKVENLLHTFGRTLEEAIYAALEILKVPELTASFEEDDSWDFTFHLNGHLYIAEAKGKGAGASKRDVNQLGGWLRMYLEEHPDVDPDELCGLLIVNHFKDRPPDERWPDEPSNAPLTSEADRFLPVHGRNRFITTMDLFNVTSRVLGHELEPRQARSELETLMRRRVNDG